MLYFCSACIACPDVFCIVHIGDAIAPQWLLVSPANRGVLFSAVSFHFGPSRLLLMLPMNRRLPIYQSLRTNPNPTTNPNHPPNPTQPSQRNLRRASIQASTQVDTSVGPP